MQPTFSHVLRLPLLICCRIAAVAKEQYDAREQSVRTSQPRRCERTGARVIAVYWTLGTPKLIAPAGLYPHSPPDGRLSACRVQIWGRGGGADLGEQATVKTAGSLLSEADRAGCLFHGHCIESLMQTQQIGLRPITQQLFLLSDARSVAHK